MCGFDWDITLTNTSVRKSEEAVTGNKITIPFYN